MTAAFVLAGYSAEDLAQDNAENGIGGESGTSKPNFVIPLEYRLEEGSLVVKIPVGQVKESGQYQIRSLELLNMFGAADQLTDGYMLVPDGSGSLIRLNNGKVKEEQYVQRVYGPDPNDNSYRRGQVSQNARMPVFGMKAGDGAWFAVIEKGDAIASIAADISGKRIPTISFTAAIPCGARMSLSCIRDQPSRKYSCLAKNSTKAIFRSATAS